MTWRTWATPLLLAAALTGLNSLKPPHMDDSAYLIYAREFAVHPSRPYEFEYGSPTSTNANNVLVPPVLPAWLAIGVSFLGDDPFVLKLWLFPFAWMLTASVAALFRRFTPTIAEPLTWLTIVSPVILPSFNFMLEVPVLGLQSSALVLTMRACDRGRWKSIVAAGVVAGLALQTKYTAFAALGAMALWCLLARRPLFAGAILTIALGMFVGWEGFVALRHGESHFLVSSSQRGGGFLKRVVHLILPFIANLGGVMPTATILGLAALGCSNRALAATAAAIVAGFLALAFVPDSLALWGRTEATGKFAFSLFQALYGSLGFATCAVVLAATIQMRRLFSSGKVRRSAVNVDLFLVLWLAGEIGWYFAVTPFPAARRVLGAAIVVTLLIGRLADRTCSAWPRRGWVWCGAIGGGMFGLLFFAVDWREADAMRQAAALAAHGEFQPPEGGSAWFVDQHSFGASCHLEGLKPLALNRTPPRPGDLVFVPEIPADGFEFWKNPPPLRRIGTIAVTDSLPLKTYANYYIGSAPLRHLEGPRYTVAVFRFEAGAAP